MSTHDPKQTTESFSHRGLHVHKGKAAPTLYTHGRSRYVVVPAEWVHVLVYNIEEGPEDRVAREAKESRLLLRREQKQKKNKKNRR
jgi:hypothetical protein